MRVLPLLWKRCGKCVSRESGHPGPESSRVVIRTLQVGYLPSRKLRSYEDENETNTLKMGTKGRPNETKEK